MKVLRGELKEEARREKDGVIGMERKGEKNEKGKYVNFCPK